MNTRDWGALVPVLITYGGLAVELLALALIPFVLLRRKEPAATIAWILVLVFLPGLGATLYLLFGRSRVRWSARRKRTADEALSGHLIGFRASDPKHAPLPLAGHSLGLFRVSSVLSRGESTLGNRVDVMLGGTATYAAIGEAIDAAQHHVHAEYYLIQPDKSGQWLFDKLIEASRRGVQVRLLCDGWGCFALPRSWIRNLRDEGVKVTFFFPLRSMLAQPVNLRNHRKIVVVDGKVGFTGGINIGDEYLGKLQSVGAWRDTHIRIVGPAVAELQSVFLRDWFFSSQEIVRDPAFYSAWDEPAAEAVVAILTSGPDTDSEAIHRVFFGAIAGARDRVYITTPYFVPDRSLVVVLQMAALQGVEVRLLLPSRSNHTVTFHAGRSFYDELMEAGVHIHEYQPGMIHAKTMVVDGHIGLVGSANMDLRSFRLNFEVHALISDEVTAHALEEAFHADLRQAREVTLTEWRARGRVLRVAEGAARLVSPLL
ncbi:MAG: cardiolipin synthase [Deltaproteobacteria bacterium]|nr:cardiolipin synthase [Deltaproteobacteria bacterium]